MRKNDGVTLEYSIIGSSVPVRYHLLAYKKDHLWLPAGIWALFAIMAALLPDPRTWQVGAAFLAVVLPLLAGIMAASCVLEDPALELQLASPRRARRILLERLVMLLVIVAAGAVAFQLYLVAIGVDLAPYGPLWQRQILWLAPTLAMLGVGSAAALGAAGTTPGALVVGLVWLSQVLLHDWFIENSVARYLFLFSGYYVPDGPVLLANSLTLVGLAAILVVAAWRALERQERYL